MIGYQMVGTNKFNESAAFYDALLGELGAKRMMEDDGRFIAWAVQPGQDATVGNGGMTAFAVGTPEMVDKMYAKAIELGGTCEGPSGPRGEGGFYGGYFRDPDGNKCNFFSMTAPSS